MFKSRAEKRFSSLLLVRNSTSFFACLLTAALGGLNDIHIKESAFLIRLAARKRRAKNMKFENHFCFYFN